MSRVIVQRPFDSIGKTFLLNLLKIILLGIVVEAEEIVI